MIENKVAEITINDFDRSIYAFWHSVLKNTKALCEQIENTEVNIKNWQKAKAIQKNKQKAKLLDLGFSTFFLNRTNISGILDGGLIGGKNQTGKYKMDCRFNKIELIKRIKTIAKQKKRIHLYNLDALELIQKIQKETQQSKTESIFYFDPPYYLKGQSLYINYYKHKDHEEVSRAIQTIKNLHWIVSYDNTPEIKKIYKWVNFKKHMEYSLLHTALSAREGKEILFFSKKLIIPKVISPTTQQ